MSNYNTEPKKEIYTSRSIPNSIRKWLTRLTIFEALSVSIIFLLLAWRIFTLIHNVEIIRKAERFLVLSELEEKTITELHGFLLENEKKLTGHREEVKHKAKILLSLSKELNALMIQDKHIEFKPIRENYFSIGKSKYDQAKDYVRQIESLIDTNQSRSLDASSMNIAGKQLLDDILLFRSDIMAFISAKTAILIKEAALILAFVFLLLLSSVLFMFLPMMRKIKAGCIDLLNSEDQAQKAKEDAIKANLSKTRFLANVSHDIRSPLSTIIGFTELISENSHLRKQDIFHLERIENNAQRVISIVEELLIISRSGVVPIKIELTRFSLKSLLLSIQSDLSERLKKNGFSLQLEGLQYAPDNFLCDSQKLYRILENLLGNAFKHSIGGTIFLSLSKEKEGFIYFNVLDSGPGIPKSRHQIIFEPFISFNTSKNEITGETGLGLAISREFARALGGNLTLVNSESGKGSLFRLSLPLHNGLEELDDMNLSYHKELTRDNLWC